LKVINGPTSIAQTVTVKITDDLSLIFRALPVTWSIDMQAAFRSKNGVDETRSNFLQSALMIIDSLAPGQIEFDADRALLSSLEYAEAVLSELTAFGFTFRHYREILKVINEFNGYTDTAVTEAQKDFLAAAP
jgi:hypothetical protein